jgi:hypothetical protein
MAAHAMNTIDRVYASVFEGILGERISKRPVHPFPWHVRKQQQVQGIEVRRDLLSVNVEHET